MNELKTIETKTLDRAAYLMCWGADMIKIEGKYPENRFTLEASEMILYYEKHFGFVNYRKFCNMRKRLKRQIRKLAGLPPYFHVGKIKGTRLMDIARYVPWK